MRYSFEKNGINYNIIMADDSDSVAKQLDASHHCKCCNTSFNSDRELAPCPNGCEGLIRGNVE